MRVLSPGSRLRVLIPCDLLFRPWRQRGLPRRPVERPRTNIEHLGSSSRSSFVEACVLDPIDVPGPFLTASVHLASLAPPPGLSEQADLHAAHRLEGHPNAPRVRAARVGTFHPGVHQ